MFKEGGEPNIYRDNLAEEIKEAPKEERKDILEQAKQTKEYQVARNKKIEGRQEEEKIDDGLGVFIKHRTLYHGSATPGIEKFKEADDTTVGYGLYLTSKAKDAIGYANERSGTKKGSVLYEVEIKNMKLVDLRNDENLKKIMASYRIFLREEANKIRDKFMSQGKSIPIIEGMQRESILMAIKSIDEGDIRISNIQSVTVPQSDVWNNFWKAKGYDGLITIEGGEGYHKGNHDSYVIFDPEKVKINKEQKIEKEVKEINV